MTKREAIALLDDLAEELESRGSGMWPMLDHKSQQMQEELDESGFGKDVMQRDPDVADEINEHPHVPVDPYEHLTYNN